MPRTPHLLADCRATLGEGLVWDTHRGVWWWTDITDGRLWQHNPATGETRSWEAGNRIGSLALCQSDRLLLAFAKQLAWGRIEGDRLDHDPIIAVEANLATTRCNDGRTDRQGNFVFGTMNEAPGHAPIGHFYQFSIRHGLRRLNIDPVGIANSICFSPQGDTMYFCDSETRRIMCGDYDADAARVENVRRFVALEPGHGVPDGSVVDADGALWNAQWGASIVRRYAPDGTVLATSPVPARHVTCPAFGGPSLDVLCATTARQDISADWLEAHPETGGVFLIDGHGAKGLADARFAD